MVKYLGHMVGYGSVKPSKTKTQGIQKFPIPRNVRELRRFLGMTGYYRRFCKNFSGKAAPLTDLFCEGSSARLPRHHTCVK